MKVYRVTQVTVIRQSESPLSLLVQATGVTASSGWKSSRLDATADPNPSDGVHELSFEAERPAGTVLPFLELITASVLLTPSNGADAVVVSARTNSITVHASDFLSHVGGSLTTLLQGEESSPTTLRLGEEGPPTTLGFGEEQITTFRFGEEHPWTGVRGEDVTTLRLGEEGPWTDPRVDDPVPVGTGPIGETRDPFGGGFEGGGGPFGRF